MKILFSDFYLYDGPGLVESTLTSLEISLWKKNGTIPHANGNCSEAVK